MNRIFLLTFISMVLIVVKGICQPQIYSSYSLPNQNWEDNSTWTKSEPFMADNPGTNLNSTSVNVNGTVTRTGSLSNGGSTVLNVNGTLNITGDLANNSVINVPSGGSIILNGNYSNTGASTLDIYGTVIVKGNLTTSTSIRVRPGGLLIVLGNLTVTNAGAAAIVNEGNVVAVGEFSTAGDITTGDSFYIFDDVPAYDWGATVDGTNWNGGGNSGTLTNEFPTEASIPTWLNDILIGLGVNCGGLNTIGSAQTTCSAAAPATLTGSAISGATYTWESSITSASSGFSTASGTSNGQNYSPSALSQTTWFRRRVTNGACSATSAAIEITIFSGSVWTGAGGSVYGSGGNWCGGTPTTTTDAFIPSGRSNYPSSGSGVARNLTIQAGASLTVSSSATLGIYGNLTNSGTLGFQSTTGGTISFLGASQQTITGGPYTFSNLEINNSTGSQVVFQSNITVNRVMTLTSGVVNLSGNTLTLGTAANNVTNAGTLTYTAGRIMNGTFTRWMNRDIIAENDSRGLFPMGTSTDNRPLWIYFTTNADRPNPGGTFSVVHSGASTTTTGLNVTDTGGPIVRRQDSNWSITSGNGITGGNYRLKAGGTGFGTVGDLAHLRLMRSNAAIPTSTHVTATGGFTDFLALRTGVSLASLTGGALYIGSTNGTVTPLPITLLHFNARETDAGIQLDWATSMEKNFGHFEIERASADLEFTSISNVLGKGGLDIKSDYSFLDEKPAAGKNYYRLKSIDLDNTFDYSSVVVADWDGVNNGISIYPNPITARSFTLDLNDELTAPATVSLVEARGYVVSTSDVTSSSSLITLPDNLSPGIYFVKVSGLNGQKTIRVVVSK